MNNFRKIVAALVPYANELLAAHLELANRGWHTIEVQIDVKVPYWKGWRATATVDPDVIRGWRSGRPLARIGIPMGRQPNGDILITLDEDRPGVLAAFAQLHGQTIPKTYRQTTRRGTHYVFRISSKHDHLYDLIRNCTPAEKLDVILNSFVLAAPSRTSDPSIFYKVIDDRDPVDLPHWLFMLLVEKCLRVTYGEDTRPPEDEIAVPYERRLQRGYKLAEVHPKAISGEGGNKITYKLAVALTHGLILGREDAITIMKLYNKTRCEPHWSDDEIEAKVDDAIQWSTMGWGFLLANSQSGGEDREQSVRGGSLVDASSAATVPPRNVALAEITGAGQSGVWFAILDGARAGARRQRPMTWPPTEKSEQLWAALAAALGLDAISDPYNDAYGRRVRIEILDDARCGFRFGRVYSIDASTGNVAVHGDETGEDIDAGDDRRRAHATPNNPPLTATPPPPTSSTSHTIASIGDAIIESMRSP